MKILQVSPCFYPAWAYGGPVPVIYHLSKELVKRGHEVTVYATDALNGSERQKMRYLEIDGIKAFYFRNISNTLAWKRYFLPPAMLSEVRREIKSFDVVHIHSFRDFPTVFAHHYARKHGIPYIIQAHGSVVTFFQKGMQKRIFDAVWGYRILKDASKVIALTTTEAEQYKSMGVSEDKIEIVPNGIDLSEFDNLPQRGGFRKKWGINDNQKIILYLARIHKIKGPVLLVKAFAELSKEIDNVKLVIAGPDDGYLPSLKKSIADLEMGDKILFTGPLYGEEKLEAYIDADVYVLPSIYETFPVGVLEACVCGTPVIVTDRCGIADTITDTINGQVGLVVPYDKDQLRDAIAKLLCDEGLRIRFGEEGRRLVKEEFGWDKIIKKLEGLYEDVTNKEGVKMNVHQEG